jgi:leucyl-tRNA synthetase
MGRGAWYQKWLDNRSFIVENDRLKDKSYVFSSFTRCDNYGFLDGNVRPYILADIYSRYLRMRDKNVLMPVGFNTLSAKSFIESKRSNNL